MATAVQKITLSPSRDIPFNKLVLSQSNVRRVKAGVSIEELAEDIARRSCCKASPSGRCSTQAGAETGMFEIPAGGRRYRALELLVKQKRLAKTAPVPCVVRDEGIAEEDSLAENIQRAPLHPLDQFRAFLALREKGQSEEEIAAAFFVSVKVVKQRLRLASVSPTLLDVYAEDGMTLDQLMAFTVSGDHERQEQVLERLQASYDKEPYRIRRMLTEGAVRASDKRAQFIGVDAYVAAGGMVLRDLFQGDDGGWLQDAALRRPAGGRKAGARGARRSAPKAGNGSRSRPTSPTATPSVCASFAARPSPLTAEEEATRDALQAEYDRLDEAYAEPMNCPTRSIERLSEIETALAALDDATGRFRPGGDRARRRLCQHRRPMAVCVSSAAMSGPRTNCRLSRSQCRRRDDEARSRRAASGTRGSDVRGGGRAVAEPEEDEGLQADPRPADDRADRTPHAWPAPRARRAAGRRLPRCSARAVPQGFLPLRAGYLPGARSEERQLRRPGAWAERQRLGRGDRCTARRPGRQHCRRSRPISGTRCRRSMATAEARLFAHCVGLSVNAVCEAWNRRPRALAHADRLAQASTSTWQRRVDADRRELSRPGDKGSHPSGRGRSEGARCGRSSDRASEEGRYGRRSRNATAGTGWLPEPLRTPERAMPRRLLRPSPPMRAWGPTTLSA